MTNTPKLQMSREVRIQMEDCPKVIIIQREADGSYTITIGTGWMDNTHLNHYASLSAAEFRALVEELQL